jgi:hypothetical protein
VPCTTELGDQAAIAVDADAVATPACLRVKKGKTSVAWTAGRDVKLLIVAFKDAAATKAPEDPACAAAQCVLAKAKHAQKQGEFHYSIVVVREDGSTATVDPRLIIEP